MKTTELQKTREKRLAEGQRRKAARFPHSGKAPAGALLYTKAQMAAALQICERSLERLMKRGDICYLPITNKLIRFWPEAALRRLGETSLVGNGTAEAGSQSLLTSAATEFKTTNTNHHQP